VEAIVEKWTLLEGVVGSHRKGLKVHLSSLDELRVEERVEKKSKRDENQLVPLPPTNNHGKLISYSHRARPDHLLLQPRVQRGRTSLPSHSKAPKAAPPSAPITTADGADDDFMDDDDAASIPVRTFRFLSPVERADIGFRQDQSPFEDEPLGEQAGQQQDGERPEKVKVKKADKAYNKRKALLESAFPSFSSILPALFFTRFGRR
jgi:hypothetical protein